MEDEIMKINLDNKALERQRNREEQMPEEEEEEEELYKLRKESSLFVTCKPWLHRLSQIHGLSYMINLTSLTLHMNELNELDVDVLSHLRQLEELDLSGNEITSISSHTFTAQRKLKRLNLSSNQLCSIAPMSFNFLYSLEWLCLAFNELDDITSISHFPPTAPLLHVDVCGNCIGKLENVQEALSTHGEQLRSLRLRIPRTSQIPTLMENSTTAKNCGGNGNRENRDKLTSRKNIDVENINYNSSSNFDCYVYRNEHKSPHWRNSAEFLSTTKNKIERRHQTAHLQESLLEQKIYNCETEFHNEHDTSIPFVHENPFLLQEFTLTSNVNECEYIKQILHVCPNLHTLDGKICGVNVLELVSHTISEKKKEIESEQPVLLYENKKVDHTHQSTNTCTSHSHKSHVRIDSSKIESMETKPRRSHSQPLLTSPQAASNDKNKNVKELSITPASSFSSSSCSPESTLSSRTHEGSKVATNNTNTTTTTDASTKSSAARSLDYSATNGNQLEKSLLSEESSYDVSLIEAELNDVLCKQQKQDNDHVRQELHSLYNSNYHHNRNNNNLYGHTNYDILHNYSGRDSKSASQNVLLSNFVLEKMPEIDKSAEGEMELCELRSGRPVHSLRWRPHRRSIGLNTLISINVKEKFNKAANLEHKTKSAQKTNPNANVSKIKSKNDDNDETSSVIDKVNSDVLQAAEGSMETEEMQRMLDAFGLHSELVDALEHEKKDMTKRLGKAMQQMALQRATEMELHEEIAFTRKSLSQYKVGSTHTINKQESQISSLKDELLRRASEIQIMHKRSNADLTLLQERLTRRYNFNINTWTSLLTSEFIARLHLVWQEWSVERYYVTQEIYQLYQSMSGMESHEAQNKSEHTRQLTEWQSAENATRKQLTHLREEVSSQKAQFTLETLETTFRQGVKEEEQKERLDLLTRPFLQKSTELITHKAALNTFQQELICKEAEWSREYENMKSSYEEALAHAKDELHKLQHQLTRYKEEEHERQQREQELQKTTGDVSSTNTVVNIDAKILLDEQPNITQATKQEEETHFDQTGDVVTCKVDSVSELVEYWKVMCAKREHEIEQLRVACSVSESTQQVLSNENTRLLHKINEEAKEYEVKLSQFARERENLLRTLHNVEDSLKKKDHELDLLEEEAKVKIDEKRTRIAELAQINDELVEEQKNIGEQNVKLRSSLESVENELQKTQSTVQDMCHTTQIQSERIQELQNQVHELQATQAKSITAQEELIRTKSTLVSALRSARDQLVSLHQSHLTLSQQQQLWESMYASKDEEVRRLQRQVAELQSSSRERQRATLAALSQVILNEHSVEPITNNAVANQI